MFGVVACTVLPVQAQHAETNAYQYDKTILEIPHAGAPYIDSGYVVFTAQQNCRSIGIAFDYENYAIIHPFQIRSTRDMDGTVTANLFFYVMPIPPQVLDLSYRLIIDGLWTADPLNPDSYYDEQSGVTLSRMKIAESLPVETAATDSTQVRFVYSGAHGQTVKLSGSFTNWDPWIYTLKETQPGFYELSLPLPPGTYYYQYVIGMDAFIDHTNPERAYTAEGRTASVITVN